MWSLNLLASLSAGSCYLMGTAHGEAANRAATSMLEEIRQSGDVDKFIKKVRDNKEKFRLVGFGYRIYKNYNPRARINVLLLSKKAYSSSMYFLILVAILSD
nr:citrate/2-methylcitrate synthase [Wolbachia endosymbiont of Cruorifilaria tuberocauda]